MKITNVAIKNYRALKDINISLNKNMNVLYGINGIGKSSFLYILHDTLLGYRENNLEKKPICLIGRFIDKNKDVEINIKCDNGASLSVRLDKDMNQDYDAKDFISFNSISLIPGMPASFPIIQKIDDNGATSLSIRILPKFVYTRGIQNFDELINNIFNLESEENKYKVKEYEKDKKSEYMNPVLKKIRQTINMVNKEFINITVEEGEEKGVRILVVEKSNGDHLNLEDQLSSGESSIIAMLAEISIAAYSNDKNRDTLILIDEVDTSLHPEWQVKIGKILKEAFPEIQFILSSHSPFVWAGLERDEIIWLDKDSNGKVIRRDVAYGKGGSVEEIVAQYFDTPIINSEVGLDLRKIEHLIDSRKFRDARIKLAELENKYGKLPLVDQLEFKIRILES